MEIKMKGILKGLKIIYQLFSLHKEHEMEIGCPTDVRHVSHVDVGTSDACPSWMIRFRGLEESSAGSMSSVAQSRQTSWASLDFEQPPRTAPLPIEFYSSQDTGSCHDVPRGHNKVRSKKKESALSPSSSRSRASFTTTCSDFSELHGELHVA